MIQRIYRYIFWAGYLAVLFTAVIPVVGNLDKVRLGRGIFEIRLDHLLHVSAYFLICMYYLFGRRKGLKLFKKNSAAKFILLTVFLGVVTEIVQIWVPARAFNVMDIVANLAGIGLGMGTIALLDSKSRKQE
ncbi:MAG: VanZ family protein [Bacteroidales bacterium]|nr:VanZ family protein [Bacteroidales bacterium]